MNMHVVLLGHGSRAPGAQKGIERAASDLASRTGWSVRVAHMELASPRLGEVVAELADQGVERIRVVPYFLHVGIHLKEDIPGILREIAGIHPDIQLELTSPLGYDARIAEILERRVLEVA